MRKIVIYTKKVMFFFVIIVSVSWIMAYSTPRMTKGDQYDICIYGATSAGVIAAYAAKKMGKSVILIEPGIRIGGLSAGGLGQTDIGNKNAITGLARDFYKRVGKYYGKEEQWVFEPKVALQVYQQYLKEVNLIPVMETRLIKVNKQKTRIESIEVADGSRRKSVVHAKIFIDCSYEGDLMAASGVSYAVGREADSVYNETYDGVQLMKGHQFPDSIDPYKIPGDSASGLLWGISDDTLQTNGTGDKKIQAYNYRICLTDEPQDMLPITRPDRYDSSEYELLLRLFKKKAPRTLNDFFMFDTIPNHKTDINNKGAFSTDMIGANYDFPDGDYNIRKKITEEHEDYTKGLLYFVGHDARVPENIRQQMLRWGYPKDEYPENNHWTPQLYIRESRRMIGEYVMTQANCQGKDSVSDGVGLAAYTMDSHNCERIVVNGMVKNEGNVEIGGFKPYPISYRSLVPKEHECINLIVPVCLSASHIAYGSIRMEPVFMVLGESAARAAALAIDNNCYIQKIDIKQLQKQIEENL